MTTMDARQQQLAWKALTRQTESEVTVPETLALFWGRMREAGTTTPRWDWDAASRLQTVHDLLMTVDPWERLEVLQRCQVSMQNRQYDRPMVSGQTPPAGGLST